MNDRSSPAAAVAYPYEWAVERLAAGGLRLGSCHPGGWCGHPRPETWQDVLVVERV